MASLLNLSSTANALDLLCGLHDQRPTHCTTVHVYMSVKLGQIQI